MQALNYHHEGLDDQPQTPNLVETLQVPLDRVHSRFVAVDLGISTSTALTITVSAIVSTAVAISVSVIISVSVSFPSNM